MNDKKENLISVIVPLFNMEPYLEKCLDSLIGQTYRNLEIILVNDASTDGSGEICDRYAAKDGRVKVIHRKNNGGISAARNSALDIAAGEYIGFADSDDWLDEDMYQFLMDNLSAAGADISICGFFCVLDDVTLLNDISFTYRVLERDEALSLLLQDKILQNFYWCKLYKRSLFDEIRMPEGKVFEDAFTQHMIFEKAQKVVLHNVPKYHYFQRINSISKKDHLNNDYLQAFYERVPYFLKKDEKHFSRRAALTYVNILYNLYKIHSGNKQTRDTLRERYAAFCRDDAQARLLRPAEKMYYNSFFSDLPVVAFFYHKYRNIGVVIKNEGFKGVCQRALGKIGL